MGLRGSVGLLCAALALTGCSGPDYGGEAVRDYLGAAPGVAGVETGTGFQFPEWIDIELTPDVTLDQVDALADRMTGLDDGRFEKSWMVTDYRLLRPNGTDHADEVRGSPLYLGKEVTRESLRRWFEAGDASESSVVVFRLTDSPADLIVLADDEETAATEEREHGQDELFADTTFREWHDGADDWSP